MVVANPKFLNATGVIDWENFAPYNGYVVGSEVSGQTVQAGTIIDRYGNQFVDIRHLLECHMNKEHCHTLKIQMRITSMKF